MHTRQKEARINGTERYDTTLMSDGTLRFDRERQRRRKAEKRVRTTAVEFLAARQIQQKLFPAAPPVLPGLDVAGIACPAEATGGDYFDYVPMLNEGVGIVVGDVSGHGFGPALLMASTRAYLRAFAQTHSDLGELLSLVNRVLGLDMEDNRFVTLVLARFDPRTGSLVYVSAGHPTGHVLDPSGQARLCLPSTGLPLGVGNESYSASPVIPLQPGELVILLSDGVTEATAPDGTAFGSARAISIVRVYREDPPARIVANLYHAVRAFSQNAPQLDDITAVVIKIKQAGADSSGKACIMNISAMVQPVYDAIQQAIATLSREEAVALLDELAAHCEAKRDRIEEEIDDDE